ncbi:MAG: phosphoribosylanthranilate isomerase [Bauldia litoralis]
MIAVKICGITRLEDALAAVEAGADAIGFVFWDGSARRIHPDDAARIAGRLPPFVARVGVFVDAPVTRIRDIRDRVGLSAVQLHGNESPEAAIQVPGPVIKAFRGPIDLARVCAYPVQGWLLDGAPEGRFGGAGEAADAEAAAMLVDNPRFILAGGLRAETVAAACRRYRPAGVDVASGVETAPGVKDHVLLRRFVAAAKAADAAFAGGAAEAA